MKKFLLGILLLMFLSSCVDNSYRLGYLFDLSDYQLVQEGVTSKERVLKIMGSPTLISNLDEDETWIYFSEKVERTLFFIPDIKERTILTLKFDRSETVKSVERFDLSDEKKMKFLKQHTEVNSNKIGFFKSIFSNVGQVKAAQ